MSVKGTVLRAVALAVVFSSQTLAQGTWAVATSPENNDLWGVCWSGTQYVAVGDAGVILTSADGSAWTRRASGTTAALRGVTYAPGLGRYFAVGDAGTVLTSSDGAQWSAQAPSTTFRLNGVAAGGETVLAVGEAGVVLSTRNGSTWTSRTVDFAWLRGVAYGNEQFFIGGQRQPFYSTSGSAIALTPDGSAVAMMLMDNSAVVEALSASSGQLLAAGRIVTVGSAERTALSQLRFGETLQPGSPFYFRAAVWFNDSWITAGSRGRIVSGGRHWPHGYLMTSPTTADLHAAAANATSAVLVGKGGVILRTTTDASAPEVRWAGSPSGAAYRGAVQGSTVTLQAEVRSSATAVYHWFRDGIFLRTTSEPVLTLTNVEAKESGLYVLKVESQFGSATLGQRLVVSAPPAPSGLVDTSFFIRTADPVSMGIQSDGKVVYAIGYGPHPGGISMITVKRLHPDGSPDGTFVESSWSGAALIDFRVQQDGSISLETAASRIRLRPDGGEVQNLPNTPIIANLARYIPLTDGSYLAVTLRNNIASLIPVGSDGIEGEPPTQLTLGPTPPQLWQVTYQRVAIYPAGDGGWYVAAIAARSGGTTIYGSNATQLWRVGPDGVVDPEFGLKRLPFQLTALQPANGWLYYVGIDPPAGLSLSYSIYAGRLSAQGDIDPGYRELQWSGTSGQQPSLALLKTGEVYWLENGKLRRFRADGTADPDFGGPIPLASGSSPLDFKLISAQGEQVFITGPFSTAAGVTRGVARVRTDLRSSSTRLTNLSARQRAGAGDDSLLVGFIVTGTGPKSMLLRGVGPGLEPYGVSDLLPDPELRLLASDGAVETQNDDWLGRDTLVQAAARLGAFPISPASRDAAAFQPVKPGLHTLQVRSKGASGVAIAEAYDADGEPADENSPRILNFSVRGFAGNGDQTLIAGFCVTGPGSKRVAIRATGPSLAPHGVSDPLPDPILTVYSGKTVIGWSNDDARSLSIPGAFTAHERDAGVILDLSAGTYTAQVTDTDGRVGTALIEVYELP